MTPRTLLGALAVGCLLTTGACGGDSPDPARPSSSSTSASSDGSPSGDSSADAEPSVEPATGAVLSTSNATLHAPAGWSVKGQNNQSYYKTQFTKDGLSSVTLNDLGLVQGAADPRKQLEKVLFPEEVRKARFSEAVLGGAPAAKATFDDEPFTYEAYGAFSEGAFVEVYFTLDTAVPAGKRRELVDSVLASFEWK